MGCHLSCSLEVCLAEDPSKGGRQVCHRVLTLHILTIDQIEMINTCIWYLVTL